MPAKVVQCARDTDLEKALTSTHGWTGGDAAYSVPCGPGRTLWLFGDSFIGSIEGGVRRCMQMVHNAAGVENLRSGAVQFAWRGSQSHPQALLEPSEHDGSYYWPGDGVCANGRLALFCKRVKNKPGPDSGFAFDWLAVDLLCVANPQERPQSWRVKQLPAPGGEAQIFPGAACFSEGNWVYVYGTIEQPQPGKRRPCVLMRIASQSLTSGDTTQFQYWCHKTEQGKPLPEAEWSSAPLHPLVLFDDAAPEMSVSTIAGLPGYWAIYTPLGLSARVVLRYASQPQGPWSKPLLLYESPEAQANQALLCYGAKAHPELARTDGELVITYCLNPGGLAQHRLNPFVYFPKAIRVVLKPR